MKAPLPSPAQTSIVKQFLAESTNLHIDGVRFNRHGAGLEMRVDYRDPKGFAQNKRITAPDTDDFTEVVVEMSNFLEWGIRKVAERETAQ